jgi:hypothetical protein
MKTIALSLLLGVAGVVGLSSCGSQGTQVHCASSVITNPDGSMNIGFVPCDGSPTTAGGSNSQQNGVIRFAGSTINCLAVFTWGVSDSPVKQRTAPQIDDTITVSRGTSFSITGQSRCGAGGSATVSVFKDGTLLAQSSKVGPDVAEVSGSY